MLSLHLGHSVHRVLLLTSLALLCVAQPVWAQRGGCMQRQMTRSSLQSSVLPQQTNLLSQPFAFSQPFTSSQALQQAALQAQLSALQNNAFLAQLSGVPQVNAAQLQLNALQQNALATQLSGQLTAFQLQAMQGQQTSVTRQQRAAQREAVQIQLEDLQATIQAQQAAGELNPSQLRALRRQESALKKQLRALRSQSSSY
jgi:hypothetical protein